MFEGEALGLNAMYATKSIRVPKPYKVIKQYPVLVRACTVSFPERPVGVKEVTSYDLKSCRLDLYQLVVLILSWNLSSLDLPGEDR